MAMTLITLKAKHASQLKACRDKRVYSYKDRGDAVHTSTHDVCAHTQALKQLLTLLNTQDYKVYSLTS